MCQTLKAEKHGDVVDAEAVKRFRTVEVRGHEGSLERSPEPCVVKRVRAHLFCRLDLSSILTRSSQSDPRIF